MIELTEELRLHRSVPADDWRREAFSANGTHPEAVHARTQREIDPWEMIIDKVVAMQWLGDDWDGLGAVAPTRQLLASALGLSTD